MARAQHERSLQDVLGRDVMGKVDQRDPRVGP